MNNYKATYVVGLDTPIKNGKFEIKLKGTPNYISNKDFEIDITGHNIGEALLLASEMLDGSIGIKCTGIKEWNYDRN